MPRCPGNADDRNRAQSLLPGKISTILPGTKVWNRLSVPSLSASLTRNACSQCIEERKKTKKIWAVWLTEPEAGSINFSFLSRQRQTSHLELISTSSRLLRNINPLRFISHSVLFSSRNVLENASIHASLSLFNSMVANEDPWWTSHCPCESKHNNALIRQRYSGDILVDDKACRHRFPLIRKSDELARWISQSTKWSQKLKD